MEKIEIVLEKVAEELNRESELLRAEDTLVKIAFAKRALDIISLDNENKMEKTAAPSASGLESLGGTLTRALVAGVGLGLAGEVIGAGHAKVKKMLFESKLNSLANEVKKQNPELKNTNNEEVKKLLRAGYTLAPDIMENPLLAASFVSIGKSLGGKIDPNTMKLMAETQSKSHGSADRNPFAEALPNAGSLV